MKTEHHPGTHAQKALRGVNSAKVPDPAKAAGAKDSESAGGFLTLLTQLETDQATPASLSGDSQLPGALSGLDLATNLSTETGLGQGPNESADHSALLAQLGQGFVRPVDGDATGGVDEGADSSGRPGRGRHVGPKALGLAESTTGLIGQNSEKASKEILLADSRARSEAGADAKGLSSKVPGHVKPDTLQAQILNAAQEVRNDKYLHVIQAASVPELSVQANPAGLMDGTLRQAERALAKFTTARTGDNVDGVWGSQTLFSGSPQGIEPANPTDATVAPELALAEQVKYWISQDVQNAELKIDGFDGLPVDVSITLKGNEASVDFRTDQEGIREILQNTESHLKDVLAREGLVLSGVSIGASTQQGGRESPQGRAPDTRRRLEVSRVDSQLEGQSRQARSVPGKSIDVFV